MRGDYTLTLVTAPTEEPVTIAEAKVAARIDEDVEDAAIADWIEHARLHCENEVARAFCTQTWDMKFDVFPCATKWNPWGSILVPMPPLASVTSITYIDVDGASQTFSSSDYTVRTPTRQQGRIDLNYNESWPTVRSQPEAVTVRFICGYGAASAVPKSVKAAIYLIVGHLYANREETTVEASLKHIPMGVSRVLDPVRWGNLP